MKIKLFLLVAFFVLLSSASAYAGESQRLYASAIKAAKDKDFDGAFMSFRELLTRFPGSPQAEEALFATGEFYFLIGDHADARAALIRLVTEYPRSKARIFALVYLLKIAEKQSPGALAENLRKEIITSKQLVLLFRDFKEFLYLSPLARKHKATHFIDKVEFTIDGEPFAQITY